MDIKDLENSLVVFTDGSSLGNPGPGGYGVVIISPKLDEIIELGGMKPHTTNNEMELTAILSALSYIMDNTMDIHIYTDSQYAINGIEKWMYGWSKNGWQNQQKEDIKNKQVWQSIYDLVRQRGKDTIFLHHVRGHVGIPGNERVDTIARELAGGTDVELFRGKASLYPISNIMEIPFDKQEQKSRSKKSSTKAFSYLSLVDGVLQKHTTWSECESRVTGRKAKFKKATSAEHEQEILRDWGL